MDSLVFRCPGCQQPFQVLAEQAGQMVRCPGCEDTVKIPAARGAANAGCSIQRIVAQAQRRRSSGDLWCSNPSTQSGRGAGLRLSKMRETVWGLPVDVWFGDGLSTLSTDSIGATQS